MKKEKNYQYLCIGLFLAAFSFNLYLAPYDFAAGGVSGLALIIHKVFNINESIFILIANLCLLVFSYALLGSIKTRKTILGSILFPLFITLTSYITTKINIDGLEYIVIAVLGGISSGIGYGFIFKSGFTSGGTDILNQIIEKYFHISISKSILIVDGLVTLAGGFTFGLSTLIYSLIALVLISIFSNKTITGIGENKTLYIFSNKCEEIKNYLHEEMKIDSTDFDVEGGHSRKKGKLILTVINTKDYYRVKEGIKIIDEYAFYAVTNAYQLMNANVTLNQLDTEN